MVKTMGMVRKVGLSAAVAAAALSGASVQAANFDVTAEVQNTLEVGVVEPMNLGNLFVNQTDGTAGIGSLVLTPEGGIEEGETDQVITSLGGQSAARASVATDQNFKIVVPTATFDGSSWAAADDVTSITDVVEVRFGGAGGDPNVARLYLANFTVGDIDGGSEINGPAAAGATVEVDPDFGVTEVTFGIGAEIFTDDSGTRTQYETGTYEGSFEVTAEF
ncbi:MAG: hypothetical protein HLX50_01330 [Alteromonadaceae bacterium]|nr:hypothetical protein [Alteromonadaceae bacterium]